MKILLTLIVLLYPAVGLGIFNCVKGGSQQSEKTIPLKGESKVVLRSSYDINIHKSHVQRVEIQGPQSLVDNLVIKAESKTLEIDEHQCTRSRELVEINVYLSELSLLKVLGASDVQIVDSFTGSRLSIDIAGAGDVVGDINVHNLDVAIKGSGDVKLSGQARQVNVDVIGSGDLSALGLSSKNVYVSIKGSGNLEVSASDKLGVEIYGNGNVKYKGRPKISMAKYGTGSIQSL